MKERASSGLSRRRFLKIASVAATGRALAGSDEMDEGKRREGTIASRIVIAQVKVYPVKGDMETNHETLVGVLREIEERGKVDVVITPEGFLDGYVSTVKEVTKKDMAGYAIDPQESRYVKAVRQWSRRNGVWLIYGCTRKAAEGIFNTSLIINRSGGLTDMYDKLHLQTHDCKYDKGEHLDVYDSDFGKFGVMICADRRWPETVRTLALKGARIVFNPTYGMHGELNLCMMRTRAYENGIYIAFTHPGQSLITGPGGNIVCNNEDEKERFTVTKVDLSDSLLDKSGHLRDRRVDVYRL